ncbi:MAG TPA: alanine--glyoxylate aminotransferase family protein [Chloroflexota bacterium]|nr:alanine--glyoxylate aminotransferase family protein [Chloroflexota bacterium]
MLTQREGIAEIQAAAARVERTLLMIPGPTAITAEVLAAGARPVLSHSDPRIRGFVAESLARLRTLFDAPSSQPIIAAGSGTLAMEIGLANLIEPGERVLILETGVFGGRFRTIADRNGAEIQVVASPLGRPVDPDDVRRALEEFRPKVMTMTHVDTSTGVRVDVAPLARLARERDALVVVDGVCSIGGEEFHGDAWGVDVALTASQKAIGAPPGLAIVTVGPRARAARENRRTPFPGYFTDFLNWLPVMESYEGGSPGYFGTPAVTLLANLHTALEELAAEPMPARVARHARIAGAFKAGVADLGLQNVAAPEVNANTLTVVRNPAGVGDELVDAVRAEGVTIARAIHPELRGGSFRVGHMGICGPAEILTTLGAIERALHRLGEPIEFGAGLGAAQRVLAAGTSR